MTKAKEQIWEMFNEVCRDLTEQDQRVQFHEENKQVFFDEYQKLYDIILKNCMDAKRGVKTLDRHKVAAIATISGIQSNFVSLVEEKDGTIFLGKEMVSLSVALSFLQAVLNMELRNRNINVSIKKWEFPKAFTCKTDYFDIMVRNLYYSQKYWQMNPLELSEKFFLIELRTLEKNNIDTALLHEY